MEPDPERKKQSAIEFAKEKLNLNPEATYADIKAQARFEGIPIFPVVYGRAKALLGLVPTAPYGSKSKARKQAALEKADQDERDARAGRAASEAASAAGEANGRGSGSSAPTGSSLTSKVRSSTSSGDPVMGFEAMIEDLRTAVQERDRYRAVLEKIIVMIRAEIDG